MDFELHSALVARAAAKTTPLTADEANDPNSHNGALERQWLRDHAGRLAAGRPDDVQAPTDDQLKVVDALLAGASLEAALSDAPLAAPGTLLGAKDTLVILGHEDFTKSETEFGWFGTEQAYPGMEAILGMLTGWTGTQLTNLAHAALSGPQIVVLNTFSRPPSPKNGSGAGLTTKEQAREIGRTVSVLFDLASEKKVSGGKIYVAGGGSGPSSIIRLALAKGGRLGPCIPAIDTVGLNLRAEAALGTDIFRIRFEVATSVAEPEDDELKKLGWTTELREVPTPAGQPMVRRTWWISPDGSKDFSQRSRAEAFQRKSTAATASGGASEGSSSVDARSTTEVAHIDAFGVTLHASGLTTGLRTLARWPQAAWLHNLLLGTTNPELDDITFVLPHGTTAGAALADFRLSEPRWTSHYGEPGPTIGQFDAYLKHNHFCPHCKHEYPMGYSHGMFKTRVHRCGDVSSAKNKKCTEYANVI